MKPEEQMQIAVCDYINIAYQNVYFVCDGSGMVTSMVSAKRFSRQRPRKFKTLDIVILHPANGYHGLVIELKDGVDKLYKKDGTIKKDAHLMAQEHTIFHLCDLNYMARFCTSFDEAKATIDNYFKQ